MSHHHVPLPSHDADEEHRASPSSFAFKVEVTDPYDTGSSRASRLSLDDESTVGLIHPPESQSPSKPEFSNANRDFLSIDPSAHAPSSSPINGRLRSAAGGMMRSKTVLRAREKLHVQHDRWTRKGKRKIGVLESLKNIWFSSYLNLFLIFLPASWAAHFSNANSDEKYIRYWATFILSFLAIIPLEKLAEFGGEQLAFYVGPNVGDFLIVTMHNAVEAILGLILLSKCELRLLQSTIIGVVLLRLLFVPGAAYIVGGIRVRHQKLHSKFLDLNQALLIIGVMSMLIPVAFVGALKTTNITSEGSTQTILEDDMRGLLLRNSRGLAIILLTLYIASRIYMHRPPAEVGSGSEEKVIRKATVVRHMKQGSYHNGDKEEEEPEVNPWVCVVVLIIVLALLATTAEWLVYSIDYVRKEGHIGQEMFGLIVIPIVSFSADATMAIGYFLRSTLKHFLGKPKAPDMLASVHTFEIAAIVAACFIVNHVTADNQTNWAEGYAMVAFYAIIALFAFQYPGQSEVEWAGVCENIMDAIKIVEGGGKLGKEK